MSIRSLLAHRTLLALLVAAALVVALMTILVIRQQQSEADGQVFLEAGGSVGAHPFVPLMVPPAVTGATPMTSVNPGGGGTSFQATAGTDNRTICDREKLVSSLARDPQASEAWVHALNSDRTLTWSGGSRVEIEQIPSYIRELTPSLLADDLRVTNHQYRNGSAVAVQAVLEKGTAVLVDAKGIARVRCVCGNPLTPMAQLKVPPVYRGTPWPGFQPQRVVLTQRGPRCGAAEYQGEDGRCHRPDHATPPGNDRRPDPQPWQDKPAPPADRPDPDNHGRPDERPDPDNHGRPDERPDPDNHSWPAEQPHPDKPDHPHESAHSGKPGPDGLPPHYPDRPGQPKQPHHPDKSPPPDPPKNPGAPDVANNNDKQASSYKDKPAENRPVGSKAVDNPAQPDTEPDKPARKRTGVHQHGDSPQARPVRQDRPDKPVPSEPGKPGNRGDRRTQRGPQAFRA